MRGVAAYKTTIKLGGTPTAMTDEATTQSSADGSVFTITSSAKRILNRESSAIPTVSINGSSVSADTYDLNYLFGKIDFESTKASSATVTLTGEYIPIGSSEKITHCHNHDLTLESDNLDATGYAEAQASNGARERVLGLSDATLSLGRYEDGGLEFVNACSSRDPVLIEIRPGGDDLTFRGWYYVESVGHSGGIEDLEDKDISFVPSGYNVDGGDYVNFGWSS